MVGTTLSQQLKNYFQTMHDQGILDHHFDHVKALQNEENPQFVMEVISMCSHDAETSIAHLTALLYSAVVDFAKIISFVHQLRGSSSRALEGRGWPLLVVSYDMPMITGTRRDAFKIFERVKQEYNTLRECLNTISQMERCIIATNETRRRQP